MSGGVLWKRCSFKFRKIDRKTPAPESLFNKNAGAACNFIKKETLAQVFSCEFCEISKNTFFYRTPLVAAFVQNDYKDDWLTMKTNIQYTYNESSYNREYYEKKCLNNAWKTFNIIPLLTKIVIIVMIIIILIIIIIMIIIIITMIIIIITIICTMNLSNAVYGQNVRSICLVCVLLMKQSRILFHNAQN